MLAETIKEAAELIVEAGWLIRPRVGFGTERAFVYQVNECVLDRVRSIPDTCDT